MSEYDLCHYRNLLIATVVFCLAGFASCNIQNYNSDRAPQSPRTYCIKLDNAGDAALVSQ